MINQTLKFPDQDPNDKIIVCCCTEFGDHLIKHPIINLLKQFKDGWIFYVII